VVKTFIIDAPTILLFGIIFAKLNRQDVNGAEMLKTKMFTRGLVLTTLFIGAALWAYTDSPDWMWMYYPPDANTPVLGILYVLVFMYYVHFVFGYIIGIWLERKKKHLAFAAVAVALVLNAIIMALTFERYLNVGTYAEFHAVPKTTMPLADPHNPVALSMNLGGAVVAIYAVYCLVMWWREGKAAKAAA
jgi:hypothetical protein